MTSKKIIIEIYIFDFFGASRREAALLVGKILPLNLLISFVPYKDSAPSFVITHGHISPPIISSKKEKTMTHFIHNLALITWILCSITLVINAESHLPPFSCGSTTPPTRSFPFCDVELPIKERARDLVSRLTLDEKISQLVNKASAIPRLGVPYYQWWSEALHGVAVASYVENGVVFNGTIKAATSFPQVILTASTFDVDLWYRMAKVSPLLV